MGVIVDSSVAIAAERSGQSASKMVASLAAGHDTEAGISTITVLEMSHGVARADTDARRALRQLFLDDLLAGMPVFPVTVPIALRAGRIDGLLKSRGVRIALADLLIGATALDLGYEVVTLNVRHFEMIPDLVVRRIDA